MSDKEAGMPAQSKTKADTAADAPESTADAGPPPADLAEKCRKEWADANGVDPSAMTEIHYPGGWVDRFDGAGWVRENGA